MDKIEKGLDVVDPTLAFSIPFYRLVSEKMCTLTDLNTITYEEVLRLNAYLDIQAYTSTAQDGIQSIEMETDRNKR